MAVLRIGIVPRGICGETNEHIPAWRHFNADAPGNNVLVVVLITIGQIGAEAVTFECCQRCANPHRV